MKVGWALKQLRGGVGHPCFNPPAFKYRPTEGGGRAHGHTVFSRRGKVAADAGMCGYNSMATIRLIEASNHGLETRTLGEGW